MTPLGTILAYLKQRENKT